MNFHERPDELRLAVHHIVDDHRGEVAGYDGRGVQLTMPGNADQRLALIQALRAMGGEIRPDSRHWFPACNGEPNHQLRWKRPADEGNRSAAYVEFATFDWT